MDTNFKEVYFSEYCSKCRFKNIKENREPCDGCLEEGARIDSHRPINFKATAKIVRKGRDTSGNN